MTALSDPAQVQIDLAKARRWLRDYQQRRTRGDISQDLMESARWASDWVANAKRWLSRHGVAIDNDAIDEVGFSIDLVGRMRQSLPPHDTAIPSTALPHQTPVTQPTALMHPRTLLVKGLHTYFDKAELRGLSFELGINFEDLRGETLPEIARELVTYCERRQQIEQLLAAIRAARPNVTWPDRQRDIERDLAEARTPLANRRTPLLDESFGLWSHWLMALALADQHVGTTVGRFQERFRTTREQLAWLRACKKVHHGLHDLQLRCYGLLMTELEQSPIEWTSGFRSRLGVYLGLLDTIISTLEAEHQVSPFIALDEGCFHNLHHARDKIKLAIDQENMQPLHLAVASLGIIVAQYPSAMNGQLWLISQQLQLHGLIEALTTIAKAIRSVDSGRVQALEFDINRLQNFEQAFNTVIEEHNQWQHVNNQLPLIADLLPVGLTYCKRHWDIVCANAVNLYHHRADGWANDLQEYERRFSSAIAKQDLLDAQRAFSSYRSGAIQRFYGVDQKLLEHCEQLNRLDGPLSFLIGVVV